MPPTQLQILKAKVTAFKEGLSSKKAAEKKGAISYSFAEDINRLIEKAKEVDPKMGEHLPPLIKFFHDQEWGTSRVQHTDYVHAEIILNQIIGIIDLFDEKG